jgi:CRISPR/Cas system-associated exonuclease Cas4 (RecB family)
VSEQRIKAWSYSRLKTYKTCPRKAKYTCIDKLKEPENEAMRRGSAIHSLAEHYINGTPTGDGKPRPNPFEPFNRFAVMLDQLKRKKGVLAESRWTFTESWGTTDWYSKDAWLRMGIDANYFPKDGVLKIVDFKTGKVRDENQFQLSLYALGGFELWPKLRVVETEFWYLDAGEMTVIHFERSEHQSIKDYWMAQCAPMLRDTMFPARPGMHCKWCAFSKDKGGPCEF